MALSNTELLEQVEASITAALNAQDYQVGGRRVIRPDIEKLMKRRDALLVAIAREGGNHGISLGQLETA